MDYLQFCCAFNNISVMSSQWKAVCNETAFSLNKYSAASGIRAQAASLADLSYQGWKTIVRLHQTETGPTKDRKGLMPSKRTEKNIQAPKRTFIYHFIL